MDTDTTEFRKDLLPVTINYTMKKLWNFYWINLRHTYQHLAIARNTYTKNWIMIIFYYSPKVLKCDMRLIFPNLAVCVTIVNVNVFHANIYIHYLYLYQNYMKV